MYDNLSHSLTRVNESIGSEHFTCLMRLKMIQHQHFKFAVCVMGRVSRRCERSLTDPVEHTLKHCKCNKTKFLMKENVTQTVAVRLNKPSTRMRKFIQYFEQRKIPDVFAPGYFVSSLFPFRLLDNSSHPSFFSALFISTMRA